jgi:hypothetical protein
LAESERRPTSAAPRSDPCGTCAAGTLLNWEEYYDNADLPAARASFDDGLADIATRLVARFSGRVVERYLDGPR